MLSWEDFGKVEMRVGTVLDARVFPEARKPAYKLEIDFGESIGILHSSAQITVFYTPDDLIGEQVIAVVNFAPKKIAGFVSQCLVLGLYNENNDVILLKPERKLPNGCRVG